MPSRIHVSCCCLLGIALVFSAIGHDIEAVNREAPARSGEEKTVSFDLGGEVKIELARIEPGSFEMGDEKGDAEEKPVHKITIGKPFYLGSSRSRRNNGKR
jgi:formylglycine-generating enzyme required for sulfatase activity